jgi:hypothetical protein
VVATSTATPVSGVRLWYIRLPAVSSTLPDAEPAAGLGR